MQERDRKLMLYAVGLLAAGIVFVAGSVFVRQISEYGQGRIQFRFVDWLSDLKTVEGILREIGFALLIAFLVTIAVEMYLRNLQVRERKIEDQNLKRDVLAAIFGITEPRQVVDKVLRLILQEKFYRKVTGWSVFWSVSRSKILRTETSPRCV